LKCATCFLLKNPWKVSSLKTSFKKGDAMSNMRVVHRNIREADFDSLNCPEDAPETEIAAAFKNAAWITAIICLPRSFSGPSGHLRVTWNGQDVSSIEYLGNCDCDWVRGACDTFRRFDEPCEFEFTIFGDGDSGQRCVCFGGYHHRFLCQEFGMGWYPDGAPVPCDGSCQAPADTLPAPVLQKIESFLAALAQFNETWGRR
jgi:hypothetical protein